MDVIGSVTKLKNLSDVHSILLGGVENNFQLVIQKESYETAKLRNCEWPLKLAGEKINTYWESWYSRIGQNVHLSDVQDRFEVIKIFHLLLYSIKINLFKHILRDKMWCRTIGKLNLNWTMPKILIFQKL